MNIYVGNLSYEVTSEELRAAFEPYGEVTDAEVIIDRRRNRSRGYGFVQMAKDEDGRKAIDTLNGSDFHGREMRVDESQPKDASQNEGSRRNNRGGGKRRGRRQGGQRPGNQRDNAQSARAEQPAQASGGVVSFIKRLFGNG